MEKKKKDNLHILVVDDEKDSRQTIVEYLKTLGYDKVTQAENGAEALRILDHDSTVNFLISDWDMPLMDGFTLLQRIRAHPTRAHLPFLVVTSPVSKEMEKVVLAAENLVDSYIIKPFRIKILEEKIEDVMSRSIHGPQKQVVIADDDPDARQMVVEYLKKFGFKEVIDFENGSTALAYVLNNTKRVGLIVSDWDMPDLNGLEFLRNCKSNKDLASIPFLMITSQSSIEKMKIMQAAKASVDQYLLKPFNANQIKSRIDSLMDRFRSGKEVQEWIAKGQSALESARYEAARESFENALKLDSTHDTALRGLGEVLIKIKSIDAALPYFRKAVDANPYNARNYITLSNAYEQKGFMEKAITLLQVANETISFSAELHYRLGELYYKKNLLPKALFEFQRTTELDPDHLMAKKMLEKVSNLIEG